MSEITWRLATKADEPEIMTLLLKQSEKIGYTLDYPDMWEKPILRCEVAEQDGKIVGAMYFEAVVECVTIATDGSFTKEVMKQAPRWGAMFKALGFRVARAFVPVKFKKAMSRYIKRTWAVNLDDELSHFFFDLRG